MNACAAVCFGNYCVYTVCYVIVGQHPVDLTPGISEESLGKRLTFPDFGESNRICNSLLYLIAFGHYRFTGVCSPT